MLIIALMLAAFWVGYAVGWTKGQQAALRLLHDVTVRDHTTDKKSAVIKLESDRGEMNAA